MVPNLEDHPQDVFWGSYGQLDLVGGSQRHLCSVSAFQFFGPFMIMLFKVLWFVSWIISSKAIPAGMNPLDAVSPLLSPEVPSMVTFSLWKTNHRILLSGHPSSPTQYLIRRPFHGGFILIQTHYWLF